MKKLLLLGGLKFLIPVITKAKALGHYVITCDNSPENPAHTYADEYHCISIIDTEAVLLLAKKLQIDGIMSFAVDPGVFTASYVAEQMGLPSPGPLKSIKTLQNKGLFREFLKSNNFNVPLSKTYVDINNVIVEKFPIMVKPVDSAGSKGVSKVDKKEQLTNAIKHAMSHSLSKEIIIEEYIQSKGFPSDSDCFSLNGEFVFISFSNQRFDKESPNPFTPSGFSWPSDLTKKQQVEISNELQRLISLLEIKTSLFNVEVRIAQNNIPYLMEVSPRGGGNRISEMLEYATGIDLISSAIQAALDLKLPEIRQPKYKGYWGEITLHSNKNGIFHNVEIDDTITSYVIEKDIWVSKGDNINAFTGANETIGTIVINCPTKKLLEKIITHNSRYIKINLK